MAPKETLDLVYSRMASVDRLSFRTLASSVDIRKGLEARRFKVLKSHNSIKDRVMSFGILIKKNTKAIFEAERLEGKFSITLDEYTAINNKR